MSENFITLQILIKNCLRLCWDTFRPPHFQDFDIIAINVNIAPSLANPWSLPWISETLKTGIAVEIKARTNNNNNVIFNNLLYYIYLSINELCTCSYYSAILKVLRIKRRKLWEHTKSWICWRTFFFLTARKVWCSIFLKK